MISVIAVEVAAVVAVVAAVVVWWGRVLSL